MSENQIRSKRELDQVSDSENDDDDDGQYQSVGDNLYARLKTKLKSRANALLKQTKFRICLLIAVLAGYSIYFGFAIYLTKPFDIPTDMSSSDILTKYIFSNNRGWTKND
jgi:hypothetical protein